MKEFRYHNITKDDMLNGDGLRVVLWVAGCSHKCKGCHNQCTWNPEGGIPFDDSAKEEIFDQLKQSYISGITFSGGDPFHENNIEGCYNLLQEIKEQFPNKTIWVYSGYELKDLATFENTGEEVKRDSLKTNSKEHEMRVAFLKEADVFVDGKFVEEMKSGTKHWAGSTNQTVWRLS